MNMTMRNSRSTFGTLLGLLKVRHTKSFTDQHFNEHPYRYNLPGLSKMLKKQKFIFFSLSILLIPYYSISFSVDNQVKDGIHVIDVRKNYPVKEIILTDIADVTYLYLNTTDDDFLYRGYINYVTDNTIVVFSERNFLFFSRDGKPKSRFNRFGNGPEEYRNAPEFVFNENSDEIFVINALTNYIQVYSSTGEYKRKVTLPQGVQTQKISFFDDQSLLVYDEIKRLKSAYSAISREKIDFTNDKDSSLLLISKTDGMVLEYVALPNNYKISLSNMDNSEKSTGMWILPTCRITKCSDGMLLCNPETDTVFLYGKDKSITPIVSKIPLLKDLDPMVYLDNCMDFGRYLFTSSRSLDKDVPDKYYMVDKKTSQVFHPKIILPDYKGKEFLIKSSNRYFNENEYHFDLDLLELKEAFNENRLSGKLKELVSTLNELEDNNIHLLVNFK